MDLSNVMMDMSKFLVPEEIKISRMNTCLSCEHYINLTQMCAKCMCLVPAKVSLKPACCPELKWHHYEDPDF
jgi:hypothetical protein